MKSELIRRQLLVKKSPIHGYGVFADENFNPGDVIEESYTLKTNGFNDDFQNFYFANVAEVNTKQNTLLPLGLGSIFNHSAEPNAAYIYDPEHQIIRYTATKYIKKGEEIFIHYGQGWFAPRLIKEKKPRLTFRFKKFMTPNAYIFRFAFVTMILYSITHLLPKYLIRFL